MRVVVVADEATGSSVSGNLAGPKRGPCVITTSVNISDYKILPFAVDYICCFVRCLACW